jgi:hypothetical protein
MLERWQFCPQWLRLIQIYWHGGCKGGMLDGAIGERRCNGTMPQKVCALFEVDQGFPLITWPGGFCVVSCIHCLDDLRSAALRIYDLEQRTLLPAPDLVFYCAVFQLFHYHSRKENAEPLQISRPLNGVTS